jgi:hypothetical protein
MGWLRRKPRSRFPADMLRRLELLGRCEMDYTGSGVDVREIPAFIVSSYNDSQADPEGFLADLRAVVADDTGGFATYGASCLVFEMFGSQVRYEDALALLDGGIAFKRERGLPSMFLKGYEWVRWQEVNGSDTW